MSWNKHFLKGLIEESDDRNLDGLYSENDVIGVSTNKELIPTKAILDGVNLRNYKLLPPKYFAFVADTSRRGDKMALAYNNTTTTYIVSTWYVVFCVSDKAKNIISSDYLFMFFNRTEFDRFARTNSWGSAREYFWFNDMEDIELELPDIYTQRKYVAIYKAMQANQQSYERGLEDLHKAFEALIDKQKHEAPKRCIGTILSEIDQRNSSGEITDVQGINIFKQFMPSVANTTGVDLTKYKVVQKGQFAYSGMQTGRDECIRIALYTGDRPIIISPAYTVMVLTDDTVLPEYVMIWFSRKEIDRLGWFMSDASIRTNLELERFFEIEIPVPSLEIQKSIAEIYSVYVNRRDINEKLKAQINSICPILIRGSLSDGG